MVDKLKYRESNYFNEEDDYVFDNNLNTLFVSKVHRYNGFWYSNEAAKYKMTSVKCVNCKEVYHKKVDLEGVKGTVVKFLSPRDIGVVWNQGSKQLPPFWNDINNLKIE